MVLHIEVKRHHSFMLWVNMPNNALLSSCPLVDLGAGALCLSFNLLCSAPVAIFS